MFLQEPHFAVGNKYQWILTKPLVYQYHYTNIHGVPESRTIKVPAGFCTDLATIPRLFHRILPVNDHHRLPAVLHDYLYYVRGKIMSMSLTRAQCDRLFLEAMKVKRVSLWKRQAMYWAVRIGGRFYWNSTPETQTGGRIDGIK
jgi:hypothetical protein